MQWIAPSEKDTATDTLEKRLWDGGIVRLVTEVIEPQHGRN